LLSCALLVAALVTLGGFPAAASSGSPTGHLDALELTPGGLHVKGWALDSDAAGAPIPVAVSSDDALVARAVADQPRTDAHGGHGFDVTYRRPAGTHKICVSALNIGTQGTDSALGCAALTFGADARGQVTVLRQAPGGIQISGWALDPDTTGPIKVEVRVDGRRVAVAGADHLRADVARSYPAYGSAHGFDATPTLAQGTHSICASAVNVGAGTASTQLLCRTITLNYQPRGTLAALRQVPGGIRITGWTLDPDTSASIKAYFRLDGRPTRWAAANVNRPDVARSYPGAGPLHGFDMTVSAPAGTHQVCAYGHNVVAGSRDTSLGCHTIKLDFAPSGALEAAARGARSATITVTGWTADPDTSNSIKVRVSLDGHGTATGLADLRRDDIDRARHLSGQHGYHVTAPASDAEHRVCVTALNAGYGTADRTLGCTVVIARHPKVPAAPTVTAVAGRGQATITWRPSTNDGGAPPTKFTVRSSPGARTVTVSSDKRQAVISGLAAATRYTFAVTATNVAGTSRPGWSKPVTTAKPATVKRPAPQTSPAPISTSRYIRNINGTTADIARMRAVGVADATRNPSGHSYLVLLDIGGQDSWAGNSGVVLSATTRFVTNRALVTAMNAYVDGYASRQRAVAPAVIAIGTNNDMNVSASTGVVWAREVVNPISAHAARYHSISIAGANDVEPGFSAGAAQVRAWLHGYLSATNRTFVFNGSADGCTWSRTRGQCNNGWTASDLYWLSGGAHSARIVGLPQIYNTTMAEQWKYISLTGVVSKQSKINFGGPLTEWTACQQARSCGSLTGHTAWATLWRVMRSDNRIAQGSLPYSTDLRIN
jgi:hypothetical protein